MLTFDVIVIGGGIVGLTAALAMAQRGKRVALIDAKPRVLQPIPSLRVYALNAASQQLFQQLNVWQWCKPQSLSKYRYMHIWDAQSQAHFDFDARLIASDQLGIIIDEATIKNALWHCISNHHLITCFSSTLITTINPNDEHIQVANTNTVWQSKLLLIADGSNSIAHQQLNIPITSWPYHQHAVITQVVTEKKHQSTAYQVFNSDGPLAFLPLNDPHHCSIVWSTTPDRAQSLITADDQTFNLQLTQAFAFHLGQVQVQSPRHCVPLVMQHANNYVGKNWLLLGDAAHTIHPLAGLGLNIGLGDVSTWLRHIGNSPKNYTLARTLNTYQRERKTKVLQTIAAIGGLKTLFANPLQPVVNLRGLGMTLGNQSTFLKRWLITQAMG